MCKSKKSKLSEKFGNKGGEKKAALLYTKQITIMHKDALKKTKPIIADKEMQMNNNLDAQKLFINLTLKQLTVTIKFQGKIK